MHYNVLVFSTCRLVVYVSDQQVEEEDAKLVPSFCVDERGMKNSKPSGQERAPLRYHVAESDTTIAYL